MDDLGLREGPGMPWKYDDGGRRRAGFRGETKDCVVRAIAIATMLPYSTVYEDLSRLMKGMPKKDRAKGKNTPRNGVPMPVVKMYLASLGWRWVPLSGIGTGCTAHLAPGELPEQKTIIARVTRHVTAIVNGTIHDTHDPSRSGVRCVYGYFEKGESNGVL